MLTQKLKKLKYSNHISLNIYQSLQGKPKTNVTQPTCDSEWWCIQGENVKTMLSWSEEEHQYWKFKVPTWRGSLFNINYTIIKALSEK